MKVQWATEDISVRRAAVNAEMGAPIEAMGPPPPGITELNTTYTTRDGFKNHVLIVHPSSLEPFRPRPLWFLIHGGGFIFGEPRHFLQAARAICLAFNAVVVLPGYRLAPDHPFPAAPKDCWDAFRWGVTYATNNLHASPACGFIIGGISAGGNLAAVLAAQARDENFTPRITGQWLLVPASIPRGTRVPEKYKHLYLSHEQVIHASLLDRRSMDVLLRHYAAEPSSPLFAPIEAKGGVRGLPKAYIQVCGMDPLRDEGMIWAKLLEDEGVPVKLDVYEGLPHATFEVYGFTKPAKRMPGDLRIGWAWLMGAEEGQVKTEEIALPGA